MKAATVIAVSCLLACTEPRAPVAREAPPDESTACARFCARLSSCQIAPESCEKGCAEDTKKLRAGFYPSFVGCLEQELSDAACSQKSLGERRQTVSLCFSATVKAWSEKDDGTSLRTIVASVCAREARCHPDTAESSDCASVLEEKLRARVTGTVFAVARPELVRAVATCIDHASCAADDAVDRCFEAALQK